MYQESIFFYSSNLRWVYSHYLSYIIEMCDIIIYLWNVRHISHWTNSLRVINSVCFDPAVYRACVGSRCIVFILGFMCAEACIRIGTAISALCKPDCCCCRSRCLAKSRKIDAAATRGAWMKKSMNSFLVVWRKRECGF